MYKKDSDSVENKCKFVDIINALSNVKYLTQEGYRILYVYYNTSLCFVSNSHISMFCNKLNDY